MFQSRRSSYMHLAFSCLLAVPITCCAVTTVLGEESSEYASLRREAVAGLQQLKALTARAQEAGIETSRERVTIVTAVLFLKFAEWDFQHPEELATACDAHLLIDRAHAEKYSRELPLKELREVRMITDAATTELMAVMEGRISRRDVPAVDVARLKLVNDYFHFNGRPLFPSSFFWLPNQPELKDAYGAIGSVFVTPAQKPSYERRAWFHTEGRDPDAEMGYVYLDHGTMPPWAKQAYNNIGFSRRVFMESDIDHPGTRDVWKNLLEDIVPQLAGRNVTRGGYMLANEPRWFTQTGEWDTGPVSEFTKAKFRTWLADRHGNVANLNQLWGTAFESFDKVTIDIPMDAKLRGTGVWYDWCRFNMDRVTAFFAFMKHEVRKHDPEALVHIKLMPEHLTNSPRSHGIDMESMVRLQDIVGCDVKVVNESRSTEPEAWTRRYAIHWQEVAISFDFFKSVAPRKMIFDSEFHGMSTVPWRDEDLSSEHMRCALWLSHLHGMGMNLTWFWGRDENGAPIEQTARDFYASSLTHPGAMNAFGRTMKELNALAPEVVSLVRQPKHVRLFYSESEAINTTNYIYGVEHTYEQLYHRGIPLGFATGQMLREADSALPDGTAIESTLVIVSDSKRVTKAEREGLKRYVSQGGNLVLVGAGILAHDEYGRPHAEPLSLEPAASAVGSLDQGPNVIKAADSSEMLAAVESFQAKASLIPPITLEEKNANGERTCLWRTAPAEDGLLLLVINLGKKTANLRIADTNEPKKAITLRDMITGREAPSSFDLESLGVALLHVN